MSLKRHNVLRTALVIFLLPGCAPATTVPRVDLPDLARSAELIVHGRVVRQWSEWDPAHRFIWTHYLLEPAEVLKGRAPASIVVSEPGGRVGDTMMRIVGVTKYADREEVVVFLKRTPIGYWRCYGWAQGKYSVVKSADGLKRVRSDLAGLTVADRQGREAQSPGRLNGLALSEFKRLVREEVER